MPSSTADEAESELPPPPPPVVPPALLPHAAGPGLADRGRHNNTTATAGDNGFLLTPRFGFIGGGSGGGAVLDLKPLSVEGAIDDDEVEEEEQQQQEEEAHNHHHHHLLHHHDHVVFPGPGGAGEALIMSGIEQQEEEEAHHHHLLHDLLHHHHVVLPGGAGEALIMSGIEQQQPPPETILLYNNNNNNEEQEVVEEAHHHHLLHHHVVFPGPGGAGEALIMSGIEQQPPPPPETILLYNNNNHNNEEEEQEEVGETDQSSLMMMMMRRRSVNTTECVAVPSSEHVAEIVGRQGCKIKALRAKTNTYIKTPVRGEQPVFVVTGRKEDVAMAKREILSAAEHFSLIRASRNKTGPLSVVAGPGLPGAPTLPGQTTIQVRVPYRVVGLVVGPKGATIKRIQQQTHTYIVTPSRDKEPVFEVTGMPENVDRAREEIEAHIALRTGTCGGGGGMELPGADDNDFHFNGTDVSFEGLSAAAAAAAAAAATAAGMGQAAWLQSAASAATTSLPAMGVTGGGGSAPQANGNFKMSSTYRNDSSSSLGSGSSSADSFYGNGNLNRMADFSPTCSLNANANNNNNGGGGGTGASFWFGDGAQPLGSDELVGLGGVGGGSSSSSGFEALTISTAPGGANPLGHLPVWSPYVDLQGHEAPCKAQASHPGTPRLSPTFLGGPDALEHPQARRVLQQRTSPGSGGAPESRHFPGYGPAFSSSSESTASASSTSPPDSSSSFPYRPAGLGAGAAGRGAEVCIHCMESPVVAALVPCGHNLFCLECAKQICHAADAACPVCFYPVTQAIQLRNM